jgi:hypothetical protein
VTHETYLCPWVTQKAVRLFLWVTLCPRHEFLHLLRKVNTQLGGHDSVAVRTFHLQKSKGTVKLSLCLIN